MQKNSITFNRYTIDERDAIAVYSKLRARHAATGLDYFSKLRTSTTLAINGISDGIGEDMLHAATVGRLEAEAYMHDVVRNMPLTIEAFEVLLVDVGEYNRHGKLTRHCQYSEVQKVINDELTAGITGRTDYEPRRKKAEEPITITADMVKSGSALDEALFAILKKWTLVSVCQLHAEGASWEDIADILGYNNAAAAKMSYQRAKNKLEKAGIEAFLK